MADPESPALPPASPDPASAESASLADHEQQFSPDAPPPASAGDESTSDGEDRNDRGQFKPRHRSRSQQANSDDVPKIEALTKRLREAEAAAGIEQQPGESARVYELRRRAELAEARRDALKKPELKPAETPAPSSAPQYQDRSGQPLAFVNPQGQLLAFPKFEAWSGANPSLDYEDYTDARQDFRLQQRNFVEGRQRSQQQAQWSWQQIVQSHEARASAYKAAHPTFDTDIAAAHQMPVNPLIQAAIMRDEQGPALVHALASQPDWYAQLYWATKGEAVTADTVALMQRTLHARVQAVSTGSAAPRSIAPAPRPPNPVRTGLQTLPERLPGDDSSLADHERAFSPRRDRSA